MQKKLQNSGRIENEPLMKFIDECVSLYNNEEFKAELVKAGKVGGPGVEEG